MAMYVHMSFVCVLPHPLSTTCSLISFLLTEVLVQYGRWGAQVDQRQDGGEDKVAFAVHVWSSA